METRAPARDVSTNASSVEVLDLERFAGEGGAQVPDEVEDRAVPEDDSVAAFDPLEEADPHTSLDTFTDEMTPEPGSDPETPPMDRGQEASDTPLASLGHGTTALEERTGDDLGSRLDEEEADPALVEGSSYGGPDALSEPLATEVAQTGEVYGSGDVEAGSVEELEMGVRAAHAIDGQADDASGGDSASAARERSGDAASLPHGPH
jgi:hypothetical protein